MKIREPIYAHLPFLERGLTENTNGLKRRYTLKRKDIDDHRDVDVAKIIRKLINAPKIRWLQDVRLAITWAYSVRCTYSQTYESWFK